MGTFTPRPPKEITQREFTDVQFVFGEQWTWQIPNRFTLSEIARVRQIPITHAHNYLVKELNKALPIEDDTPPSQITRTEEAAAQLILRTLAQQNKQARIIPNDEMINSIKGRFYENLGVNEWSDAVCKEQLDIICLPKDGAPKLSTVADRADKELMNDAINFFYQSLSDSTNEQEKPKRSTNDSGKKSKNSKKQTASQGT
jgi:hypothetical protein